MDSTPLASLSLTHVHYVHPPIPLPSLPPFPQLTHPQNPSDPLSYLCAWLALLPQALCIIYCTLIYSTREIEVLFMFVGQMGCEALNFALKRAIKEERPKRTSLRYLYYY